MPNGIGNIPFWLCGMLRRRPAQIVELVRLWFVCTDNDSLFARSSMQYRLRRPFILSVQSFMTKVGGPAQRTRASPVTSAFLLAFAIYQIRHEKLKPATPTSEKKTEKIKPLTGIARISGAIRSTLAMRA